MKKYLLLLTMMPALLFAKVGPDLELGSHVDYFTRMRFEFAEKPQTTFFPLWSLDPEHAALVKALKAGEFGQVLELADAWLRKCPIDADTHMRVAMCYKEQGDLASYAYHLGVFYGLLNSITSSGDGRSTESAFKVVSVHEEYSLIQEIGGKLEKQTLVEGPCDRMEVSRKNGEKKLTLYFNVAVHLRALEKGLKKN